MEFFESFFSAIRDRLKRPFFGAFILSFVVYNWRVFYFLVFADGKVGDRIKYVDDNYLKDSDYLTNPFLIALCYMLFQSYLHLVIDKVVLFADIRRKSMLHDKRMDDLKNAVIRAGKEKEIQDARSGNLTLADLNEKIENLTREREQLNEKYKLEIAQKNTLADDLISMKGEKDEIAEKLKEVLNSYDNARLAISEQSKVVEALKLNVEHLSLDNEKLLNRLDLIDSNLTEMQANEALWKDLVKLKLSAVFVNAYREIKNLENNIDDYDPVSLHKLASKKLLVIQGPERNGVQFLPTDLGESLWNYYLNNILK